MTSGGPLRVAVVGCGLIGNKRAEALQGDELVGAYDVDHSAAERVTARFGGRVCTDLESVWALRPDVVVVAVVHRDLASLACLALQHGAHVLVEKPGGIGTSEIDHVAAVAVDTGLMVKVGFNHRFHPGIARAVTEARSGAFGPLLFLRARYGHGGRLGYESEWRADPAVAGGGEIVDQGMHLLDLSHWLMGDLPVHAALLRTHYWRAPVDDNALIVLGSPGGIGDRSPWAVLHASWTEWKNMFSLEITCERAKWAVDGLARSYGPQELRVYRMRPELGPPDVEHVRYPERDDSWEREWAHFAGAVRSGGSPPLLGDLVSARYAWACIEAATA
ncbi:MAG: Gfo/Idh/MocA family protein [Acidimicrobiales bacterium]